jgi:hypothetical protein
VQCENEVGLLDDLLAVEVEVREVEQERVLIGLGVVKVPALVRGEALRLWVHAERLVPGNDDVVRRVPPARGFLEVRAECGGATGVAGDGGGGAQVLLRGQVGVDVVVGDCAVFVRTGDAVDPEAAPSVVMAE